eukprot:748443-Hanusia_phi.AAC.7
MTQPRGRHGWEGWGGGGGMADRMAQTEAKDRSGRRLISHGVVGILFLGQCVYVKTLLELSDGMVDPEF